MTFPQFLTEAGALDGLRPEATYVLDGPEGRHAATVKRLTTGEKVWIADGTGVRITGQVVTAAGSEVTLRVLAVETVAAPAPRITLVQALAKSDRDEAAVEAATELGVDQIVPWQAERSIVQWRGDRAEKSRQKWVDVVRAATKQCRRGRLPEVTDLETTSALVRRIERACVTYVLHEGAATPLATQPLPAAGEIILIVGPEGGVSPAELAILTKAGAIPVHLGPNVLRSSSAGPAAIAVLSAGERWQ